MFTPGRAANYRGVEKMHLININDRNYCTKEQLREIISRNMEAGSKMRVPCKSAKKEVLIKFLWHKLDVIEYRT